MRVCARTGGHEAATAILPAFLASLGAPAYALGVIEGVSDGLSSFAKLAGGWIADRPELRKPTGVIGYMLTGLSTGAYALASTWPAVLVIRALGWTARGSRGASRDVLLTDSVAPGREGRAFGYERAMDTTGAVLGPLCATALVAKIGPRGVFMWSLVPGVFAALAFLILVPRGRRDDSHKAPSFISSFSQLPGAYWRYLGGVFAHGIGDFAPTLLILRATQELTPSHGFARASVIAVGLYTFYNVVNALASYPAGVMADRVGKRGLLAFGYLLATIAFAAFLFAPPTIAALAVTVRAGGCARRDSGVGGEIARGGDFAVEVARLGLRRSRDGEWDRGFGFERGGGRAVVKRQRECGISLRWSVYAARRDFDFVFGEAFRRACTRLTVTRDFRSTRLARRVRGAGWH